jgi:hypothetical protein
MVMVVVVVGRCVVVVAVCLVVVVTRCIPQNML